MSTNKFDDKFENNFWKAWWGVLIGGVVISVAFIGFLAWAVIQVINAINGA